MQGVVLLGTILSAHGLKGEVKVKSFTSIPTDIAKYGPLFDDKGTVYRIEKIRTAKNAVILKFDNIDDIAAVQKLIKTNLFVNRDALPTLNNDEDEFYYCDLEGLDVFNDDNEKIGQILKIENFSAGDILVIRLENGSETMIPFTKANVPIIQLPTHVVVTSQALMDD